MTVLDLFSGIGGFSLGLERAGMRTVGFCEIDPYCQAVLKKHWPGVPIFEDVRNVTAELIHRECGHIDIISAGPPCQPASVAGRRKGSGDDRWLWPELLRVVFEVNPVFLLAENPRGITSLRVEGLQFSEWLARELAARGYELLPVELAAEDVGAPHKRERVWFVAYSASIGRREGRAEPARIEGRPDDVVGGSDVADRNGSRQRESQGSVGDERRWIANRGSEAMANASRELFKGSGASRPGLGLEYSNGGSLGDANITRPQEYLRERGDAQQELTPALGASWPARPGESQYEWEEPRVIEVESGVGGATNGISSGLLGCDCRGGEVDRDSLILGLLNEGRITVDFQTGHIYSDRLRWSQGKPVKLEGSNLKGYIVHTLMYRTIKKQVRAHRVVWMAAHGPIPKGMMIDHINRVRDDNRIENLRLVSALGNRQNFPPNWKPPSAHTSRNVGAENPATKLTQSQTDAIKTAYAAGDISCRELACQYGVSTSRVHQIVSGASQKRAGRRRVAALKALGNAVVPQCAEILGRMILKANEELRLSDERQGWNSAGR